ncbi:putative metal ion transporter YfjQ [Thalassobacillus devorans]|uniref:Magnesium transport protein CorA n=1 Tax=Thalassobacillus devorans TaxID=279813 RepID=A0ABQ1NT85_9BACI|nr:magnesium/cobalt transporter CorA [Thalassobacillus devorans]NIK27662.1 magnesium transporter [Thalassobacillus devorans]GGC79542.1 putative metal ion transporter YfjQ [Thalassobacillus devorans]
MLKLIAYTKEGELIEDNTLNPLKNREDIGWYWLDFDRPSREETDLLDSYFHFHPLAIEDCIHDLQRPKMDYYEDHTLIVIHSIDANTLKKQEIDIFFGEDFIITYHKSELPMMNHVMRMVKKERPKWEEYYVLHYIFDLVVDNYFPIIYEIEDHINEIEDNTQNLSIDKLLEQLFDRRSELLTMRQTIHPMRDLLYRILNSHHLDGMKQGKEYFADVHDHLIKLADVIASNRDLTQDIRDSYLSLTSHQQNKTMQVLTVISVIFMPLTFIAGVYGMNFENMPELDEPFAYPLVWFIMIALSVAMIIWFKKKGWFD